MKKKIVIKKKVKKEKKIVSKASIKKELKSIKNIPQETQSESRSIKRISSGIPNLDGLIEGGFVQGSTNLVSGGPGTGKSIFALQYLLKGLQLGEGAVYVSFEETKENFFRYMLKFGWDLKNLEKSKKFIFLRYNPEQVKALLEQGGGEIERSIQSVNAKRLVIDSVNAFALLFPNELSGREALLDLFSLITKFDCTSMITYEQDSDIKEHKSTFIEFEVDSIMLMYNYLKGNVRRRIFEILKMRGTKFEEKLIPIKIKERGIVLYPEENVI